MFRKNNEKWQQTNKDFSFIALYPSSSGDAASLQSCATSRTAWNRSRYFVGTRLVCTSPVLSVLRDSTSQNVSTAVSVVETQGFLLENDNRPYPITHPAVTAVGTLMRSVRSQVSWKALKRWMERSKRRRMCQTSAFRLQKEQCDWRVWVEKIRLKKTIRVLLDFSSDAEGLRWYVKRAKKREHSLMEKTKTSWERKVLRRRIQEKRASCLLPVALLTKWHSHCVTRVDALKLLSIIYFSQAMFRWRRYILSRQSIINW